MISLCKALTENENLIAFWEMIFTGASALFTLVLTIIIIRQTYSLNKKQQELDKKMNESQLEMQEKINNAQIEMQRIQLKQNLYDYRKEVFDALSQVYSFCDTLAYLLNDYESVEKKIAVYIKTYSSIKDKYLVDGFDYYYTLSQSKNLFTVNIYEQIDSVNKMFNIIELTYDDLVNNKYEMDINYKNKAIELCIALVSRINGSKDRITPFIEKEMDISNTGN